MDTLLNELRNSKTYGKKISITIGDISTHMLMSEYDEAEELIDILLAAFCD